MALHRSIFRPVPGLALAGLLLAVAGGGGCSGNRGTEGSIPISTIRAQQEILTEAELMILSAYASAMVAMEPPTFADRARTLLGEIAAGRLQIDRLSDEDKRILLALKMAQDRQRGRARR